MELKPEDLVITTYRAPWQSHSGWTTATEAGVSIVHRPTGAMVKVDTEANQWLNRNIAVQMLEAKVKEILAQKAQPQPVAEQGEIPTPWLERAKKEWPLDDDNPDWFLAKTDEGVAAMQAEIAEWRAIAAIQQPQDVNQEEKLAAFRTWLEETMPAGTMIGDPSWWATRIFRQLKPTEAVKATGTAGELPPMVDAWYHGITEKHFERAMYAYGQRCAEAARQPAPVDAKYSAALKIVEAVRRDGDAAFAHLLQDFDAAQGNTEPAPVLPVKTWQERMKTTKLTWKTGDGKLAAEFQLMAEEIAELRAALAAATNRSQP